MCAGKSGDRPIPSLGENCAEPAAIWGGAPDERDPDSAAERLLAASRKLFTAHGYEAVSTEMLAREARMSKSTMYRLAENKDVLFAAMLDRESERFNGRSQPLPTDRDGFMDRLHEFGRHFLELIADPEVARFERLMLSRASSSDASARLFFERAHVQMHVDLTEVIELGQKRGFLAAPNDPGKLAAALASAWLGHDHARLQLDICDEPFANLDEHVSEMIDIILRPAA